MSTIYVDNLSPNLGSRVLAAGHVVQVVNSNLSSNFTTTSSTPTAVVSVSITPTSTSSKILISVFGMYYKNNTGVTSAGAGHWNISRNGTKLPGVNWPDNAGAYVVWTGSNGNEHIQPVVGAFLDSPATTSSTTYALYLSSDNNSSSHIVYKGAEIIAQEIAQ